MKGYCYLEYYIFYIECDKYEFYSQTYYDKIINRDTATYKTDIFTVLDIFDVNGNKVEHEKYKIGEIINREIYVYFDKDIPCCDKIDKFRGTLYVIESNCFSKSYKQESKYTLDTYFNDVLQNTELRTHRIYYRSGKLRIQFQHKCGRIEGEYISYYENGNVEIKCNYVNNIKHGKEITYWEKLGDIHSKKIYINGVDINDIDFDLIKIMPKN